MGIVTLSGQLVCADAAQAARITAALPAHIALSRAEPSCLSFAVERTADPLVWQVDESFDGPASFDAHQSRTAASDWAVQTADIERTYTITGMP